jgi:hypothetical protein
MKSILDPSFRYTPSHETDLRKTFERARREQAKSARAEAPAPDRSVPVRIVRLKTGQSSR